MALVSGRPISFQMDLYTPLYVSRPIVVPELFQSLRPVAYSGSMEDETRRMAALSDRDAAEKASATARYNLALTVARQSANRSGASGLAGGGGFGGSRPQAQALGRELKERMDLNRSV